MKAVILAAGKGTRMGKLGEETPKPLLKVLGRTLLEHKLDLMPESIDEVILVVGHLKEQIIGAIGGKYRNLKITYVILDRLLGTADALFACKDLLLKEAKFLVMNGDDIYSKKDMEEMARDGWAMLICKTDTLLGRGKVVFDENKNIANVIEKYAKDEAGFVCGGLYTLTPEIFKYEMIKIPGGEYGLPQTILSAKKNHEIRAVEGSFWLQITRPEDLQIAEKYFNKKAE